MFLPRNRNALILSNFSTFYKKSKKYFIFSQNRNFSAIYIQIYKAFYILLKFFFLFFFPVVRIFSCCDNFLLLWEFRLVTRHYITLTLNMFLNSFICVQFLVLSIRPQSLLIITKLKLYTYQLLQYIQN